MQILNGNLVVPQLPGKVEKEAEAKYREEVRGS